jgi:hypothetical protein
VQGAEGSHVFLEICLRLLDEVGFRFSPPIEYKYSSDKEHLISKRPRVVLSVKSLEQ